eukprot:CAMPEP_0174274966 /NCGR_PEP_ID=MMETSP0439-20130205/59571_1 /TAXON_ID=0 /ORGANISM="Stereomyxa ramosa, Strain Chinc5" /LENGTH=429 /DNA_ID=CAMNT_0015367035 /DNA_START=11 /DNA_END=1300 /DNA_ORIENTATION=-
MELSMSHGDILTTKYRIQKSNLSRSHCPNTRRNSTESPHRGFDPNDNSGGLGQRKSSNGSPVWVTRTRARSRSFCEMDVRPEGKRRIFFQTHLEQLARHPSLSCEEPPKLLFQQPEPQEEQVNPWSKIRLKLKFVGKNKKKKQIPKETSKGKKPIRKDLLDNRLKDKKSRPEVIRVSEFEDLPEELKHKVKKAKIKTQDAVDYFPTLLNVLHFTTKNSFIWTPPAGSPTVIGRVKQQKSIEEKVSSSPSVKRREKYDTSSFEENPVSSRSNLKIRKEVGHGGFGRVFAAKGGKGKVAVKKMKHTSEKRKYTNLKEINMLKTLNHPNIVTYHHSFVVDDELWAVMEFMEGGTLTEAIRAAGHFEETHIAYSAKGMLQAVKYLHDLTIIHRDIKSGNVMMSIQGGAPERLKRELGVVFLFVCVPGLVCKCL